MNELCRAHSHPSDVHVVNRGSGDDRYANGRGLPTSADPACLLSISPAMFSRTEAKGSNDLGVLWKVLRKGVDLPERGGADYSCIYCSTPMKRRRFFLGSSVLVIAILDQRWLNELVCPAELSFEVDPGVDGVVHVERYKMVARLNATSPFGGHYTARYLYVPPGVDAAVYDPDVVGYTSACYVLC